MSYWILLAVIAVLSIWELFKIHTLRARLEIDFFLYEAPLSLLSVFTTSAYPGGYLVAIAASVAYRGILLAAFWKTSYFKVIGWFLVAIFSGYHLVLAIQDMFRAP